MYRKVSIILLAMAAAACGPVLHEVDPVQMAEDGELCIIENPDVRESFLESYKEALAAKGIAYKVVSAKRSKGGCEWTSTYVARWKFDLASFMAYTDIKVFHQGNLQGGAKYDSSKNAADAEEFIDAEEKIQELVDQLF